MPPKKRKVESLITEEYGGHIKKELASVANKSDEEKELDKRSAALNEKARIVCVEKGLCAAIRELTEEVDYENCIPLINGIRGKFKLAHKIAGFACVKYRNDIRKAIQTVCGRFLDQVEEDPELLETLEGAIAKLLSFDSDIVAYLEGSDDEEEEE